MRPSQSLRGSRAASGGHHLAVASAFHKVPHDPWLTLSGKVECTLCNSTSASIVHRAAWCRTLCTVFTADPILAQRQAQSVTAYHLQCRGASPLEPTALQTRPYTVPSRPPAVNRPTDEVLLAFRLSAKLGTAELTDLRSTAGEHPYYILWNEASTTFNSQPRPGYDVKATMSMLSAFSAYP